MTGEQWFALGMALFIILTTNAMVYYIGYQAGQLRQMKRYLVQEWKQHRWRSDS